MSKLKFITAVALFSLISIVNAGRIIIIGDSTAASYPQKRYPLHGWGQVMAEKLKGKVKVINKARSGRSSKSYINEGHWEKAKKILKTNDILLIQFGHNDEKKDKSKIGSTIEEFKKNLTLYVKESRQKGARPILISPVCRRKFKRNKAVDTHGKYAQSVAETAKTLDIDFIDLNSLSIAWLNKTGYKKSSEYYMNLAPGKYPGYPKGRKDNTHFNKEGANVMYEIILNSLKRKKLNNITL